MWAVRVSPWNQQLPGQVEIAGGVGAGCPTPAAANDIQLAADLLGIVAQYHEAFQSNLTSAAGVDWVNSNSLRRPRKLAVGSSSISMVSARRHVAPSIRTSRSGQCTATIAAQQV